MTNSTNPNASSEVKKKRTPGPIRTGVVVPLFLLGLVIFLYFKLFFDANLKWGMSVAASKINGAQVDIASLSTSFTQASFELGGLQVTDKKNPDFNILEIKKISSKLLWDGLLRGKFVMDNFSILGIAWQSKRSSPGQVLPERPIESKEQKPSAAGKLAQEAESAALKEAQKEFKGNALGDLAAILEGGDVKEQMGEIRETLETEKYINPLEQEITGKQKLWEEKIKSLPNKEELEQLVEKLKSTKLDSNPLTAAKQLKSFKDDFSKISQAVKIVKEGSKQISSSIKTFEGAFSKIDDLVAQDLKNLQTRFKIPSLDTKNLAQGLFAPFVVSKLGGAKKYIDIAREYLPPKKSAEEKQKEELQRPKPRARAHGVDYRFPKKGAYPLAWIKNVEISSKSPQNEPGSTQGNLSGVGHNFTSDAQVVGKPMQLDIKGDFPGQNISGTHLQFKLNHHLPNPNEEAELKVASYPVSNFELSKSDKLTFGLKKAQGAIELELNHSEGHVKMNIANRFRQIDYLLESQNKKVQEILSSILKGIPEVTLDASAEGSWSSLHWNFKSNLGDELAQGLKREISGRVEKAKAELKKKLDDKIGPKRKMIEQKFAQVKGKMNSLLGEREKEIEAAKNRAQGALDEKSKANKPALQEKGKNVLKGLKKKFKF